MSTTVVGVFAALDDAQRAARRLAEGGVDAQAMQLTATPTEVHTVDVHDADDGAPTAALRRLLAEFGLGEPSARDGAFEDSVRHGNAMLTVRCDDDSLIDAICDALVASGAIDVDQRVGRMAGAVRRYSGPERRVETRPYSGVERRVLH
jgi:hypothetical protein